MVRFKEMNNKLDNWADKHPDTKKWKGSWNRTKFTMALNKMKKPKLNYDSKTGRILLGKPKDDKASNI